MPVCLSPPRHTRARPRAVTRRVSWCAESAGPFPPSSRYIYLSFQSDIPPPSPAHTHIYIYTSTGTPHVRPGRHGHDPANYSRDLLARAPRPAGRGGDQVGGGAPRPAGWQLVHPAAPFPRHPRARRPCLTPPPPPRQLAHPAAPLGPPPTPSPARNTQGRSIGNWRFPPALACAPRLPLLLPLPDRRRRRRRSTGIQPAALSAHPPARTPAGAGRPRARVQARPCPLRRGGCSRAAAPGDPVTPAQSSALALRGRDRICPGMRPALLAWLLTRHRLARSCLITYQPRADGS